ncbi:MAG TPA: histidine phosphatase family protein [Burkholderiales bacterium]|nr:histidine phosphatase family protein [Burkholderiales bacterium]
MGYLVLVRHGQARTFETHSDRLSPTGEEQARALGRFWAARGAVFDEVWSGTLERQRRTAEIAGESYAAHAGRWPGLRVDEALNEYDSAGMLARLAPALAARDGEFRALAETFDRLRDTPERNRHFQRMFERLVAAWLAASPAVEGVEAWAGFSARVRGALRGILQSEGRGRRVAVFTSGGVIGLAVQTALGAPERVALELNWRVRNASLTEFTFGGGRIALDSFNALPHLDAGMHTYR